jgi:hypothetical protein
MVIQSKFKDYYDYVAHRYGGGDPRIVYQRKRIETTKVEMRECILPALDQVIPLYSTDKIPLEFAFLVVAAAPYLLVRAADYRWKGLEGYRITNPRALDSQARPRYWRLPSWEWIGQPSKNLLELSRLIGAPVFVVTDLPWYSPREGVTVQVDELCPVLKELGMPALISPEQMYQQLAYFMGNTMHPSPDTQPPVEVSNRDKIVAAGFDLQQSFRNRT